MIRTRRGTRLRIVAHEPGSQYVRCRRLEDGKEFDWRIDELRESVEGEIQQTLTKLDDLRKDIPV